MIASLDTLQIVKRLKEAGFGDPQAEALTLVFRDLRETDASDLATRADIQFLKNDIERVEAKLVTEIERVEAKLVSEIERVEAKLVSEIGRVEAKLVTEVGRIESGLEVKIAEFKVEIIRWVFGIAFAQAALILAVLRLFPAAHP